MNTRTTPVGPTIYVQLMDLALHEPRETLRREVELFIRGSGMVALTNRIEEILREAYVSGVQDGFRDAVVKEAAR